MNDTPETVQNSIRKNSQSRILNKDIDKFSSLPLISDVSRPILAVDAMGGDFGPSVVVPGAVRAAKEIDATVYLVGREQDVQCELDKVSTTGVDIRILHASEIAEMTEKPSEILRRKKDASIQVACRLVRDGHAHGLISAGHSGATVACGMFIIGRAPGVERPALAALFPTEKERIILLDVGANVDCRPHQLFQFGLMGVAYAKDLLNRDNPSLGIISIGEEEGKGNSLVKQAYDLFRMVNGLNFVGNIEGRDLFTGDIDVAVCDGFIGNVVLKTSEGCVTSLCHILKRELKHSGLLGCLGAIFSRKAFKNFAKVLDYAEIGGALLLGLRGVAIVCHGKSSEKAIYNAVKMAALFAKKKTNERLVDAISANEELTRYGRSC